MSPKEVSVPESSPRRFEVGKPEAEPGLSGIGPTYDRDLLIAQGGVAQYGFPGNMQYN